MGQWLRQFGVRHAIAAAALLVYPVVACGISLLHSDDCPLATDKTAPCDESCPACKFLAGAHSTQVLPELSLAILGPQVALMATPHPSVVTCRHWASPIIRRGPPHLMST